MTCKTSYEIVEDLYNYYGKHDFSLLNAVMDNKIMTEEEAELLANAGLLIETTKNHEREVYTPCEFAYALSNGLVNLISCEYDAKHGYFVEHLEKMLSPWYALNPVFIEQVLEVRKW